MDLGNFQKNESGELKTVFGQIVLGSGELKSVYRQSVIRISVYQMRKFLKLSILVQFLSARANSFLFTPAI